MKLRLVFLALVSAVAITHADPADDARYVARVMTKVDEGIAKAREQRDRPERYAQCEIDLRELDEALPRLPEAARAPYLAKIKMYCPEVEAGVRLGRGLNVARRIRGILDSAKADLPRVAIDDLIFETLDRHFAEPDAKGMPPEQLQMLQKEYAELKAANAARKR